jgi:hypothetical protein
MLPFLSATPGNAEGECKLVMFYFVVLMESQHFVSWREGRKYIGIFKMEVAGGVRDKARNYLDL